MSKSLEEICKEDVEQHVDDIEEYLDSCLTNSTFQSYFKKSSNWNVIDESNNYFKPVNACISGPTGCGKTARINNWAEKNKDIINFITYDGSLLTVHKDAANNTYVFMPKSIELMAQPKTVVFIDNYQCVSDEVKKVLADFFDHRRVIDTNQNGKTIELDSVLLVIVALTN